MLANNVNQNRSLKNIQFNIHKPIKLYFHYLVIFHQKRYFNEMLMRWVTFCLKIFSMMFDSQLCIFQVNRIKTQ